MMKIFGFSKFLLLLTVFFAVLPLFVSGSPVFMKADGDLLYVAHGDGTLETWDKSSGSLVERLLTNIELWGFDMDRTNFYIGSMDGRVFVLDSTGQVLREINVSPELVISSLAVDKDNSRLYIGSFDNTIRVLDMRDWSFIKVIEEHELPVTVLILDGRYLYSASGDGSVRIWDKQTMTLVKNLTTHTDWKTAKTEGYGIWEMVIYGNKIYTGHIKGQIRIWDMTTDSLVKEIAAHSSDVTGLATDGQYIFSSSSYRDKVVKTWTMEGEPTGSVLKPEYSPTELEVDDSYLYVGTREGGVLIYGKNYNNLVRELGNFTQVLPQSSEEKTESQGYNPLLLIIIVFALFFVVAIVLETYVKVKKKHGKLTKREVGKFLVSFFKVEDVLQILAISSIIIFAIGLINTTLVFPNYIPGLQAIYYFDIFIKRGAFLPVWFLLLPSVAYWMTKKYNRKIQYLALVVALLIAVVVYFVAPTVM